MIQECGEAIISHEHVAGEFVPFDEALVRLKYPTAKEALKAAKAFLDAES